MKDQISTFGEIATGLARNPLSIMALFIVLVYGFASLVTAFGKGFSSTEKMPLIYFLVGFPVLVLTVYVWLVSQRSANLFAPGDFKSDDSYVKMQQLGLATRFQKETDLKDFRNEVIVRDETVESDTALEGWTKSGDAPSDYAVGRDPNVRYGESISAYIKSRGTPRGFGTLMQVFKANMYRGKRVRMSASAKSDGIGNWAGFWMRVDEPQSNAISFDNMQDRPIKGTTGWTTYQIVLDVPENSSDIAFGLLLNGAGQVWLSNFHFEVVSNNVPTTGKANIPDLPVNLNFKN